MEGMHGIHKKDKKIEDLVAMPTLDGPINP